jgi:hypothetical protein
VRQQIDPTTGKAKDNATEFRSSWPWTTFLAWTRTIRTARTTSS